MNGRIEVLFGGSGTGTNKMVLHYIGVWDVGIGSFTSVLRMDRPGPTGNFPIVRAGELSGIPLSG